jgi:hypothetical protein
MHAFRSMSAHGRLTLRVQFQVSTPHILYACLGGFVVFVCHPFVCFAQLNLSVWDVFALHSGKGLCLGRVLP